MYQYWGFGLNILSEIEFPEFLPVSFEIPDVTVRLGKTPQTLTGEDVVHKVRVSLSPTQYLQKVNEVATYYVADGKEICIEPADGADENSIRLFMISNAMAAALHQRNMIPLHASGIYHKDGIILFGGASGVGKSTIATLMQSRGYKVFSDDVCVLKQEDDSSGLVYALPSYPMMKLWAETFQDLGLEKADEQLRLRPKLPKYARFLHEGFETTAMPIKKIFILDTLRSEDSPELVQLGSVESFNALQRNSYRHVQMNAMKKWKFHFSIMTKLAASVPVFKLSRPKHQNTMQEIAELIESHLV